MGRIGARGAKLQLQSNRHEESGERGADKFPDEFAGLQAYNGLHASTGSSNLVAFQATRDRPRARADLIFAGSLYAFAPCAAFSICSAKFAEKLLLCILSADFISFRAHRGFKGKKLFLLGY